MKSLFDWARTQRHQLTPAERALRLLWSPEVLEISDEEFAEIGRLLGLDEPTDEPQSHNTTTAGHRNTPQQEVQVIS